MTIQVLDAYHHEQCFIEQNPSVYHEILQKQFKHTTNTHHLDRQGVSRKFKAIYGEDVRKFTPLVYSYYTNPDVITELSRVTGCPLYTVPLDSHSVDVGIQLYDREGDGTDWHQDRGIYNGGRSFTFLTVIHNTSDQVLNVWTSKNDKEELKWEVGRAVLIEKGKTVHSVTPLLQGSRILLSFTYTEIPYYPTIMRPVEYSKNKIRDIGNLGIKALSVLDWTFILVNVMFVLSSIVVGLIIINRGIMRQPPYPPLLPQNPTTQKDQQRKEASKHTRYK